MYESDVFTIESGSKSMLNDFSNLSNAVDALDSPDYIKITKESFQTSLSTHGVDFEWDSVIVRNSSRTLIASGFIIPQNGTSSESKLMIQVHPEYRRQGIGSRILQHLTEVGIERGSPGFICRIPSFRPYVIPFVREHGFKYDYSLTKMKIEHETPVSTPSLPWGLTVRGLKIKKELPEWAYLQNLIFKDDPHYKSVDVEALRSLTRHSVFDRNLLILCTTFDKPVGYCFGYSISSETGEKSFRIDSMGVHPDYRRHRYGQALIFEIINRAYIKEHTSTELTILSSNKPAIRLFEKCGFKEMYKELQYKRTRNQ